MRNLLALRVIVPLAACVAARGQSGLADASLEQLLNVQVTSVSKKEQKLSRTAAAVFVINEEDIRRSGAANLPDLLRMAPGVNVARIDANTWAISIRGFNSLYSDKVLVLIDGRSVYTPAFSGVFWDQIDLPLEDIERIEVIRGPGGTVWGANAVNGVINIITKPTKATKGGLVSASAGSDAHYDGLARYGGAASNVGYRVFGQYSGYADTRLPGGSDAADAWHRIHGGFRTDWAISPTDTLSAEGDLYSNRESQTMRTSFIGTPLDSQFAEKVQSSGGSMLARWDHTLAGGSETSVRAYYDGFHRNDLGTPENERAFDIDFQHHLAAGSRHDIVWGLGYRLTTSGLVPGYPVLMSPPSRTDSLFSVFLQDEVRVARDLWLTPGCKLEHNGYTGFEYEPSLRLAWAATPRDTLWTSVGRAIRQPARFDTSIGVDLLSVPLDAHTLQVVRLMGNPNLKTEELRDVEAGYRAQLDQSVSLDVSAFLSSYRRLTTIEPQPMSVIPGTPVVIQVPLVYNNLARALNYGGEVAVSWHVSRYWRISPNYSWLHVNFHLDPSSMDTTTRNASTSSPAHTFQLPSFWTLPGKVEFDQWLSWTGRLPGQNTPSHARLDLRLSRRIGESAELSVVGQNLLRPQTLEFGDFEALTGTMTARSVYGKVTWTF